MKGKMIEKIEEYLELLGKIKSRAADGESALWILREIMADERMEGIERFAKRGKEKVTAYIPHLAKRVLTNYACREGDCQS